MENLQTMLAKDTLSCKMARAFIDTRRQALLTFSSENVRGDARKGKRKRSPIFVHTEGHKSVSMVGHYDHL